MRDANAAFVSKVRNLKITFVRIADCRFVRRAIRANTADCARSVALMRPQAQVVAVDCASNRMIFQIPTTCAINVRRIFPVTSISATNADYAKSVVRKTLGMNTSATTVYAL